MVCIPSLSKYNIDKQSVDAMAINGAVFFNAVGYCKTVISLKGLLLIC